MTLGAPAIKRKNNLAQDAASQRDRGNKEYAFSAASAALREHKYKKPDSRRGAETLREKRNKENLLCGRKMEELLKGNSLWRTSSLSIP